MLNMVELRVDGCDGARNAEALCSGGNTMRPHAIKW